MLVESSASVMVVAGSGLSPETASDDGEGLADVGTGVVGTDDTDSSSQSSRMMGRWEVG